MNKRGRGGDVRPAGVEDIIVLTATSYAEDVDGISFGVGHVDQGDGAVVRGEFPRAVSVRIRGGGEREAGEREEVARATAGEGRLELRRLVDEHRVVRRRLVRPADLRVR